MKSLLLASFAVLALSAIENAAAVPQPPAHPPLGIFYTDCVNMILKCPINTWNENGRGRAAYDYCTLSARCLNHKTNQYVENKNFEYGPFISSCDGILTNGACPTRATHK